MCRDRAARPPALRHAGVFQPAHTGHRAQAAEPVNDLVNVHAYDLRETRKAVNVEFVTLARDDAA